MKKTAGGGKKSKMTGPFSRVSFFGSSLLGDGARGRRLGIKKTRGGKNRKREDQEEHRFYWVHALVTLSSKMRDYHSFNIYE